jgi:3-oxoacyl-[acyl-carrier-protein] synthase-1
MIYLSAVAMINALGNTPDEISQNLQNNRSGLAEETDWLLHNKPTWVGRVKAPLPSVPAELSQHNSRNNQLLLAALTQIRSQVDAAIAQYGKKRIAVIMGTSTSGIYEGERAVAHQFAHDELPASYCYQQQELGDPALFLASYLQLDGPAYTLSTACTSSARAIISGKRLIEAGIVDVALVGGADSLCRMALNGFDSLESLSDQRCTPFAKHRKGINIGEAAALILLTQQPSTANAVILAGTGESSDAWHMSAPHPEGIGAEQAMRMALAQAKLMPDDVGYVNLHGTATPLNDKMEAKAVHRVFGNTTPCSSTKHLTGHTLGAAGATEAALCWLILSQNLNLPAQDFSETLRDDELADIHLVERAHPARTEIMLSNSFAFGGNNTSLLLMKDLEQTAK